MTELHHHYLGRIRPDLAWSDEDLMIERGEGV